MRCFLAFPLDSIVKKAISILQKNLSNSFDVKINWVREENLHLTIKFWNSLRENEINKISTALTPVVQDISQQKFMPGEIGFFPNQKNPRIIWLGLEGNKEVLLNLYDTCEQISQDLGFPLENKPFKPHITLARVKEATTFHYLPLETPVLPEIRFNKIVLYRSNLTSRGPQYSILKEFPLKG